MSDSSMHSRSSSKSLTEQVGEAKRAHDVESTASANSDESWDTEFVDIERVESCMNMNANANTADTNASGEANGDTTKAQSSESSDNQPPQTTITNRDDTTAGEAIAEQPKEPRLPRRVSFDHVEIREYEIILGDHPASLQGPPVTIGWEPHSNVKLNVDQYEEFFEGSSRRGLVELRMPAEFRRKLLEENHSRKEMNLAQKKAKQYRLQAHFNSEETPLDVAWESAVRKFKRWKKRRSSTEPDLAELWLQNFKQEKAKEKNGGMRRCTSAMDFKPHEHHHSTFATNEQKEKTSPPAVTSATVMESIDEVESHTSVRRVQSEPFLVHP